MSMNLTLSSTALKCHFAEETGFEPMRRSARPEVFKTSAISHSATPPIKLVPLLEHFVGEIGFEPICNHLLFLLLIMERRYTPIFCALGRIRTFMCISTVDPKSTGSNHFPHKGVY